MKKVQVITQLEEKVIKRLKDVREETDLSISQLINLRMKGWTIIRTRDQKDMLEGIFN